MVLAAERGNPIPASVGSVYSAHNNRTDYPEVPSRSWSCATVSGVRHEMYNRAHGFAYSIVRRLWGGFDGPRC